MLLVQELHREHALIERVLGSLRTYVARRVAAVTAADEEIAPANGGNATSPTDDAPAADEGLAPAIGGQVISPTDATRTGPATAEATSPTNAAPATDARLR